MSTIYRERDRYDDSRTTISSGRRDRDGGYTTVKRYVVKDDDTRSNYARSDRRSFVPERAGERVEETRIVRREREVDEPVRERDREVRRDEPRYSSEQLVIRRDNREDDRRSSYEPRRDERSDEREEIVIRRTKEVDEPRRDDLTVARLDDRRESTQVVRREYRDDYEVLSPTRGGFDDRDLTKYSRQTDFYAPAPPPQTIIIRQEPIIIRERVRDDDYVSVRRSDAEEEKSVVRRARTPDPPRQTEEDYFYEKKIRERIDDPRDRDRDREDEWRDRRVMKREVSPHDSVSQVGRRSRRNSYSSDDSMVYVKRTKEEYSGDEDNAHHKKNLAAGVIAGIGAAELLRNHKKKEGRETSRGVGRLGRDVGAGALGAIAAEGITRARSRYRSRSRRRSRGRSDSDSGGRSRSRRRSRSRSESRSKLKTWGAVGLGAAALAAAAAVAQKKMGNKDKDKEASPDRGRSSSRGRNESVTDLANDPNAPSNDARNPRHRNIRMAEAGAAGAAITALIDRARSKSRGRDRSRSRIRQAVPVVAAGLGSAALAGLYEKNKAKKEAEVISKTDRRDRRASRSRSRQRSEYSDYPRENVYGNPMIEYGDGPMQGSNYGREYYPGVDQYGRPPNQEGYYANQTAVVPAAAGAAAAGYAAAPDGANREIGGDRTSRSRSPSSSPGGHRRRHGHSRSRSGARDAAAAGGIGAAAMAEHERKERKREKRARKQQEQYGDPYEDTFNPGYPAPTPPVVDPYAANTQPGYYPQTSQFPPPPGTVPQQYPAQPAPAGAPAGAAYSNEYPPPPPGAPPVPGYEAYASGGNPYAPPRRGADENVSVPPNPTFPSDRSVLPDGVSTPRPYPAANPSITVHPPSVSTPPNPNVNLNVPASSSYIPPTERAPSPSRTRAVSQPPPSGPRKSVQFAEKAEVQAAPESEASSPEQHRHRRHRERGYEAGDDTDSTPDDQRRRQRERGGENSRSLDPDSMAGDDGRKKRHHHRRRSHEPSSSASASSSKAPDRNETTSPAESDATVDLPARFDSKGNKKAETGDDPLADRIDEILNGKGATGKLFGNFVNGIFGPEGRRKSGGRLG